MTEQLSSEAIIAARDAATQQLKFAREYSLSLIESVPDENWFDIPTGQASNVAWQVGHLAVSEYGLMLFRQRGRGENDSDLVPSWFRKKFTRGSDPGLITSQLITKEDLLNTLHQVHMLSLDTATTLSADLLWEPIEMPYAGYPCKLGAILFCPLHEMLHAGQIGSLRRGMQLAPLR